MIRLFHHPTRFTWVPDTDFTPFQDGIARRIVEAEEATTILPSSLSSRLVGALARTQRSEHMQQWLDRVKASPRWTDCPIPGVPTPHAAPWTPTRQLLKRKSYQKRGRFLVQCFEAEEVRKLRETEPYRSFPYIKEGDLVEVRGRKGARTEAFQLCF